MRSLPNAERPATGDFNLDEIVQRLMGGLVDESQWNEILRSTGGFAELVVESLDKVSKIRSHS